MGVLEKMTVFGNDYPTPDGSCIRDFIHVVDLANAHLRGLDWLKEQKGQTCEVVNVGTGKGTSVLEIIDAFEDISGQKLNWEFGPRREGDITCIYANVEKSAAVLGWKAELSATDAVRDAWRWEQKIRS